MRGSMFVSQPWGRHPMRMYTPARMGQNVVCDGGVCKLEPAPTPAPTPPPVQPPVVVTPAMTEEFPVVPVAVGVGALILAVAILGG